MTRSYSAKRVLTPAGILEGGRVLVEEGRLAAVEPFAGPFDATLIAPGYIDIHTHGGDWYDVMSPTEDGFADWLRTPGRAVLSVVHDLSLARRYGTHALVLREGRSLASGPVSQALTDGVLRQAYGMDVAAWMREMAQVWA